MLNVSIPFREELHSDGQRNTNHRMVFPKSFHPFQGRAPFGHRDPRIVGIDYTEKFPSLSGKSSIRTKHSNLTVDCKQGVSFHPFQGRAPFGLMNSAMMPQPGVYVSIPFREELHSDFSNLLQKSYCLSPSFHPFQGRAPFGPLHLSPYEPEQQDMFPSLSGKSSIRTYS